MKVLVDAFGGDKAPKVVIDGAVLALENNKDLEIVLFGNEEIVKELLQNKKYPSDRLQIVDAKEVISNNEAPVEAVRNKKESTIVKAMEMLKNDEDSVGFVSAGSTGAVLTGAFLKLGRLKGIHRPALAPIFPTRDGKQVCIIDCGANMDSDEKNLLQFAHMGASYMSTIYNIEKPRVALLSVGEEDKKGNEMTKKAFELLKQSDLNFVGNMEARYALSGKYDVIVCDGFAGNVLIKSIEGTAGMIMGMLKDSLTKSLKTKLGALLIKDGLKEVKDRMDYHKYGGAVFLGVKKIIVKSHGSSNANSIKISIEQVIEFHKKGLLNKIDSALNGDKENV